MPAHIHTFYVYKAFPQHQAILVLCPCGQVGDVAAKHCTPDEWQHACHALRGSRWDATHRVRLLYTHPQT